MISIIFFIFDDILNSIDDGTLTVQKMLVNSIHDEQKRGEHPVGCSPLYLFFGLSPMAYFSNSALNFSSNLSLEAAPTNLSTS